jgi:hypothetical protein
MQGFMCGILGVGRGFVNGGRRNTPGLQSLWQAVVSSGSCNPEGQASVLDYG